MQPKSTLTLAKLAAGLVSAAAALALLAFCIVVPLQAQQAATLAADSGQAAPCAVSTLCTCQSNEKQLGMAILEYTQDYDGKLPMGTQERLHSLTHQFSGVGWAGQIYQYAKTPSVFKCPDDPTTASAPLYPVSYGFNENIAGDFPLSATFPYESDRAETVLLFEISGDPVALTLPDEGASLGVKLFSAAGDGTDLHLFAARHAHLDPTVLYATGLLGMRPAAAGPVSQEPTLYGRHRRGSNYLLADGHAHWYLPSDVSSGADGMDASAFQRGNVHGTAAGTNAPPFQVTFSLR